MVSPSKLKTTIRFAQITGAVDNTKQFPVQQITYHGKVANTAMVFPYGLFANVSNTDSLGLLFSVEGSESNKMCLAYTPKLRPELEQNEVAVYHPYTKAEIIFKNNGNIEIDAGNANIVINCSNAEINSQQVDVNASIVNLGEGGAPIARVGDTVQVSTVTGLGTITTGGVNTSR